MFKIGVDWKESYCSLPEWIIDIEQGSKEILKLKLKQAKYDKIKINEFETIYISSYGPFYKYYFHDSFNENGFGGNKYTFHLKDGTTDTVVGPWSSRAEIINQFTDYEMTDICLNLDYKMVGYAIDSQLLVFELECSYPDQPFYINKDIIYPSLCYERLEKPVNGSVYTKNFENCTWSKCDGTPIN